MYKNIDFFLYLQLNQLFSINLKICCYFLIYFQNGFEGKGTTILIVHVIKYTVDIKYL